jgi:hypothetical protein
MSGPTADYAAAALAEIRRVMGEEWWDARPDDLEVTVTETGGLPVVGVLWGRGTAAAHSATLIEPGVVAEGWPRPGGGSKALLWSRAPGADEREIIGGGDDPGGDDG